MRDFFKGWRRKIGVIALMFACVVTAAWVQGVSKPDVFDLRIDERGSIAIGLGRQHIEIFTIKSKNPPAVVLALNFAFDRFELLGGPWRRQSFCGFEIVHIKCLGRIDVTSVAIPYAALVIPLTLLSAYLLLSKPRVAKPKKAGESTTARGA